ncbi:MAG: HEPN domain-containing protein [Bacillota bacterium]
MTSVTLAQSYLVKATKRLKILPVLLAEEAYSDVVREAQEIVELAVKGILRYIGIEPPKQHDVGYLLVEFQDRLPEEVRREAGKIAKISKWLRKEQEFAFYGDADFIPTEEYTEQDARRGMQDANFVVQMAMGVILPAERALASQKAGIDCEGRAGGRPQRKSRLFFIPHLRN